MLFNWYQHNSFALLVRRSQVRILPGVLNYDR